MDASLDAGPDEPMDSGVDAHVAEPGAGLAERAGPFEADIGCKASADFVAEPYADRCICEAGADIEIGNVLRGKIEFSSRLQNEFLSEAKIVFCFCARCHIAIGRDKRGRADFKPIGREALDAMAERLRAVI